MSDWADRMRASSADFRRLVWPVIGTDLGELASVESMSDDFAHKLDTRAGIDHWILRKDGHISGLASRVQWPKYRSFDTFSVRVRARNGGPTEYDKRLAELTRPGELIGPWYTCQAYVTPDRSRLLAAAMALTSDVIAGVEQRMGKLMRPNPDGSQGYAIGWSALLDAGAQVTIWRPDERAA